MHTILMAKECLWSKATVITRWRESSHVACIRRGVHSDAMGGGIWCCPLGKNSQNQRMWFVEIPASF